MRKGGKDGTKGRKERTEKEKRKEGRKERRALVDQALAGRDPALGDAGGAVVEVRLVLEL